ncbi:MAG: hypothetical protein GY825_10330, partial [Phycisphaeraceae bacterium]|nr:hypothetical protein [Phycisphaeraceae bacterium]
KNQGFTRLRIDGEIHLLSDVIKLARYEKHTIEIVLDRLLITNGDRLRIFEPSWSSWASGSPPRRSPCSSRRRRSAWRRISPRPGPTRFSPPPSSFSNRSSPAGRCGCWSRRTTRIR